jgi:hypothetical protein
MTEGGEGLDVLGFHHRWVRSRDPRFRHVCFLARWPSRQAMQRARERVRELTARDRLRWPIEQVVGTSTGTCAAGRDTSATATRPSSSTRSSATRTAAWRCSITRHDRYAPHLSNYPAAAGGRTFPSAAGFHTSELIFTDDSGTYIVESRDAAPGVDRGSDGIAPLRELLRAHAPRIRRIADERLWIPPREPYMEGHNSWVANRPGSLLAFPIGDVAQHAIANLCFFAQNGYTIFDDVNNARIPGLEAYGDLVNVDDPLALGDPALRWVELDGPGPVRVHLHGLGSASAPYFTRVAAHDPRRALFVAFLGHGRIA